MKRVGWVALLVFLTAVCLCGCACASEPEAVVLPVSVTEGVDATVQVNSIPEGCYVIIGVLPDEENPPVYYNSMRTPGDMVIPGIVFTGNEQVIIKCAVQNDNVNPHTSDLVAEQTYTVLQNEQTPMALTATFTGEIEVGDNAVFTLSETNVSQVFVQRFSPGSWDSTEDLDSYQWSLFNILPGTVRSFQVEQSYPVNRFRFAAQVDGVWTAWSEPVDLELIVYDGYSVARGFCGDNGDNVIWVLTNKGTLYIRGTGAMADYYIDSHDYPPWYTNYLSNIQQVEISGGVTHIGDCAFTGCENITQIDIPNSVQSIGIYAFCHCEELTALTLPEGIRSIPKDAFYYCLDLAEITIPDSVTAIGDYAFENCSSLLTVHFGANSQLETIGQHAFDSSSVRDITLPDSVETIGICAFSGCHSLRTFEIPDSVTEVGYGLFEGSGVLMTVTIPEGVTHIAENAFQYCHGLEHILYKGTEEQWNGITIDSGNSRLSAADVTIHYGYDPAQPVVLLSGSCGAGDEDDVTYALDTRGVLTISGSGTMKDYGYNSNISPWRSKADMIRKIVVSEGVVQIGQDAFYQCVGVQEVSLPDSLKVIRTEAFWECTGLTSIVFPKHLETIEGSAFSSCSELKKITIYKGVTNIGSYAFYGSSFADVYYEGSQAEWNQIAKGNNAFYRTVTIHFNAIASEEELEEAGIDPEGIMHAEMNQRFVIDAYLPHAHYEAGDGPRLVMEAFSGSADQLTVYEGEDEMQLRFAISEMGVYTLTLKIEYKDVSIPQELTVAVGLGMEDYTPPTGEIITLPAYIETIGQEAFMNTAAVRVYIPYGCETIGPNAFAGCTGLKEADIPSSVRTIDETAFAGCEQLQYIISHSPEMTIYALENGLVPVIGEYDKGGNG